LDTISFYEFLAQVGMSLFISLVSIAIIYFSALSFTEVHNSYVVKKYFQDVHCRHSYSCNCVTTCSTSGNTTSCSEHCDTCYEHSFDRDWIVKAHSGNKFDIDSIDRQGLIPSSFYLNVNMNDPVSYTRSYINYIKASQGSLFLDETKNQQYAKFLPEYPIRIYNYYNLNRIINLTWKVHITQTDQMKLSNLNARLGEKKQVNVILVLVKEIDQNYAYALNAHWRGANKNDVVVIVSTDGKQIFWSDSFYLKSSSKLRIYLRDSILTMKKFDLDQLLETIESNVSQHFVREHMKNYEYLKYSIVPTKAQFIVALIFNLICSIGLSVFFHKEEVF